MPDTVYSVVYTCISGFEFITSFYKVITLSQILIEEIQKYYNINIDCPVSVQLHDILRDINIPNVYEIIDSIIQ